jgi:hypothetical protein
MDSKVFYCRRQDMAEIRLSDFLGLMARRRIDFATGNCFSICADWIAMRTGRDPAAPWRRINSRTQARAAVRAAGGDEALVAHAMAAFPITDNPRAGDVALVRAPVGRGIRPVAAICVAPGRFALLTDRGLAIAPLPVIRAWRIHG